MAEFSPKIEIINHFDELINRVDIDIDSSIEKLNDKQLLTELVKSSEHDRKTFRDKYDCFKVEFFPTFDPSKTNIDSWPESTKVTDYLKQIRMRTIEELKKAQEETIEYYKLNSKRFKSEEKNIDQLRSDLFADKYYFQVNFKQSKKRLWPFNVFTFVTDFYLPPSYIDSLEKLINHEKVPFGREAVFDDKIVLTGLLYEYFSRNLIDLSVPNHVIRVDKQDLLNVKSIDSNHEYSTVNLNNPSTIDLSKLVVLNINFTENTDDSDDDSVSDDSDDNDDDDYDSDSDDSDDDDDEDDYDDSDSDEDNETYWRESLKINIEGLPSLEKLYLRATKTTDIDLSIKNLPSLRHLCLCKDTIDQNILTRLLEHLKHIERLILDGKLTNFNLDYLSNLKSLSLSGTIQKSFNFDLLKNLCGQLEKIQIFFTNIDEKRFVKFFDGCNFPYLKRFSLSYFKTHRLKKELFSRFTTLRHLNITDCEIDIIDHDSFSDLKQLCRLNLSGNDISCIKTKAFSMLGNLQKLDLSCNNIRFRYLYPIRNFLGISESVELNIEHNMI